MGIAPRMILILKWDPQSISPISQLIQTQKRLLTTVAMKKHCTFEASNLLYFSLFQKNNRNFISQQVKPQK